MTRRLGVVAVALLSAASHWLAPRWFNLPQNPGGAGLGPDNADPALAVIAVVATIGALLAIRFRTTGGAVIGAAAIMSCFLVAWEFRPVVWILPLPLILCTAALITRTTQGPDFSKGRRAALGAILIGGAAIWQTLRAAADLLSPTHPDSAAAPLASQATWLWVGSVSTTSATVTAGGLREGPARLLHWVDDQQPECVDTDVPASGVARFELSGLTPGTDYFYRVARPAGDSDPNDGTLVPLVADSSFRTFDLNPTDITIAFASCARTGSNGAVFDAIRAVEPDLFVQLGDLHYANLTSTNPDDHLEALGRSLSTPAQSALYSSVPSAWIWDDHDYGDNDSDSSSPSRNAVSTAYRQAVPHWDVDPDVAAPINQAFSVGPVRVITTDTRSHRTTDTMLGADQEAWLINELCVASESHSLVIWANPAPWNVPAQPGTDQWGGFPEERRRIANAIAQAGIDNLVMISGDWHLAAIDDGTNTGYADDGSPGPPLIHAAPLDRPGRGTGQTYTHGVFSNACLLYTSPSPRDRG